MRDDKQWSRQFAERLAERGKHDIGDGGIDLLALLASEAGSGLVELAPGVWSIERRGGWSAR